jgi:pimeloyl-ACP methyl ester carboxylesterase
VSGNSVLASTLSRAHRILPRAAGYVHTAMFVNTRGLGDPPDDVCPLGARRVAVTGVPRVAAVYVWGEGEPTVLALHGWGTDSTTMSSVVAVAVANGESAISFDAPGHGISAGSQATITEYSRAITEVLQRFPSIRTVVAHSLSSIAAVAAIAQARQSDVRTMLLLAPTCSLSDVLDRWAAQRRLPPGVAALIRRELQRRDGVPVSHWDIRTLGLPAEVDVRIIHDPGDDSVPISDSYDISTAIDARVLESASGTGHHGIVASEPMRAALIDCLRRVPSDPPSRKSSQCR